MIYTFYILVNAILGSIGQSKNWNDIEKFNRLSYPRLYIFFFSLQKQPSSGVLKKRCSQNGGCICSVVGSLTPSFPGLQGFLLVLPVTFLKTIFELESISSIFQRVSFWYIKQFLLLKVHKKMQNLKVFNWASLYQEFFLYYSHRNLSDKFNFKIATKQTRGVVVL